MLKKIALGLAIALLVLLVGYIIILQEEPEISEEKQEASSPEASIPSSSVPSSPNAVPTPEKEEDFQEEILPPTDTEPTPEKEDVPEEIPPPAESVSPELPEEKTLTWRISDPGCPRKICRAENVQFEGEKIKLFVPAGEQGGGSIYSNEHFSRGTFEARMKIKKVPNVIYAFFIGNFYPPPENEIDIVEIEINNNLRAIVYSTVYWHYDERLWTSWDGHQSYPWFELDEEFHNYKLVWEGDNLKFYIDERLAGEWSNPRLNNMKEMGVYLNAYTYKEDYVTNDTGYLEVEKVTVH